MDKKIEKGYVTNKGIEWVVEEWTVGKLKAYWEDRGERPEWITFMVDELMKLKPGGDTIKVGAFMVARAV